MAKVRGRVFMLIGREFLVIFLLTLVYGAVHSLLASRPVKERVRRLLGPGADRLYRLMFNVVAFLTLIPVLITLVMHPGPTVYILGGWPAVLAVAGQAISLLLFLVSFFQSRPISFLGLRQLGDITDSSGLQTTGAYGIVRHPLYITASALLWLTPVMTTGTLGFNLGVTLYILIGSELEEQRLIAEFGEDYRRYKSRVARFIPFLY
jgi:protein-S-isoprenylcysteine O-methyltransferase Ste14